MTKKLWLALLSNWHLGLWPFLPVSFIWRQCQPMTKSQKVF